MPVLLPDLKLKTAAVNTDADNVTTGGAKGSTVVVGASAGEILPRLSAKQTGTVDNAPDLRFQYQKAFWEQGSGTSSLLACRILIGNGLKRPSAPGRIYIILRDIRDAGLSIKLIEAVGGAIYTETVAGPTDIGSGNATSGAQGAADFLIRAYLASGLAYGDIEFWHGTSIGTAVYLGKIPGQSANGLRWNTALEGIRLLGIATTDDTSTIANRLTAPTGTFVAAFDLGSAIVIRNDPSDDVLAPGEAQGFWIYQYLQPGEPAMDTSQVNWILRGETGA